jgi:hypothetical protein
VYEIFQSKINKDDELITAQQTTEFI